MLRIEDNGKGVNIKKRHLEAANEKRMGLSHMQEKVSLLQGKMDIQSTPEKGTKISIEIPYDKENFILQPA
jgi:signal transduction histidine kinase